MKIEGNKIILTDKELKSIQSGDSSVLNYFNLYKNKIKINGDRVEVPKDLLSNLLKISRSNIDDNMRMEKQNI